MDDTSRMTRKAKVWSIGVAAAALSLVATPTLACPQETVDRLAATDTVARQDADIVADSPEIALAVLTRAENDRYDFSVEQALRGAVPDFTTESMIVISCRFGGESWDLDRYPTGARFLVLGDRNAHGGFVPDRILPAGGARARRLLTLIDQGSAQ
jgi:hypothetical protein